MPSTSFTAPLSEVDPEVAAARLKVDEKGRYALGEVVAV